MRVHDSQAYRRMDVTRKHISHILELREIRLSFQTGFNLVNAAVVCAILCFKYWSQNLFLLFSFTEELAKEKKFYAENGKYIVQKKRLCFLYGWVTQA